MLVLSANALVYILSFLYSYKKDGFSLCTFLWLYYMLYAIGGYYVVATGLYSEAFGINTNVEPPIIPYVYSYICTVALLLPFYHLRFNAEQLKYVKIDFNKIQPVVNMCLLCIGIYLIEIIYEYSIKSQYDYLERYQMNTGHIQVVDNPIAILINVYFSRIYEVSYPFIILYYIYRLLNQRIKFSVFATICIFCFSPVFFKNIGNANRSGLFFFMANFSFFIILFYRIFNHRIRRKLMTLMITSVGAVGFALSIISTGRNLSTGADRETGDWVMRYIGETFPNLGYMYWDKILNHTYGLWSFRDYVSMLNGQRFFKEETFEVMFPYFEYLTGAKIYCFKPIFGVFYIEFGELFSILLILLLAFIAYKFTRKAIHIFDLPVLYFYFGICSQSAIGFAGYGTFRMHQILLLIIVFSYYLKKYAKGISCNSNI